MSDVRVPNGAVVQGALSHQPEDYPHEHISHPVIGVVLNVFCADAALNSIGASFQDGTGYACQARVLVVNDGSDAQWLLSNVIVLPGSRTGYDDYAEEVPKGVSFAIDKSKLDSGFRDIPMNKLDGDWCVVDFVGGSIHQPFMVSWFPHPGNRHDPTTEGLNRNLNQGRRWVKRFQGTRFAVTSKGDIVVDTNESNHPIKAGTGGAERTQNDEGGDIYVNVKSERQLEVNFNPSVKDDDLADVLRPPGETAQLRRTDLSSILANKDLIKLIAGEVMELIAGESIELNAGESIKLIAGEVMELIAHNTLHFGTEDDADENFVLGQSWKTLMETIIDLLLSHTHPTALGPSGASVELGVGLPPLRATLDLHLSDWIFGQKTVPTPPIPLP